MTKPMRIMRNKGERRGEGVREMRNEMKISPCLGCEERYPGCFADCDRYKEWKGKREAFLRKVREERRKEAMTNSYSAEMARRNTKRKGLK